MARNGSGVYSLPAGNPVTTNTTVSSVWANNTLSDIATALTQSVSKDGQTQMTNNLPMAGYKLTGLGAGTGNGDSLRFEQLFSQGNPIDIAGATTTDIGALSSNFINITGTATITSLGANYNGPKFLKFTGASTLTYNATTLVTPTSANIVTTANSMFIAVPKSTTSGISNGWYVIPLTGYALLSGATFTGDVIVPDEVYGSGWDGNLQAPTKNAVYDKIESIASPSATQAEMEAGSLSALRQVSPLLVRQAINAVAIGVSQTWQDVTASRTLGTLYTNSTGRPISFAVNLGYTAGGSSVTISIGGISFNPDTSAGNQNALKGPFIVPAGATYQVTNNSGVSLSKWVELR